MGAGRRYNAFADTILITQNEIVLASNYETYIALNNKGIRSLLWEDCYSKDDLIGLYNSFKLFCNEWFVDKNGKDHSVYDGMSFGLAISIFLAHDLETWIRVFYLFEYLASRKINTTFHVLNKEYFPPEIYRYIDKLNSVHGDSIRISALGLNNSGIEPSVSQVLRQKRCLARLQKSDKTRSTRFLDTVKNAVRRTKRESIRCLIIHIRNSEEYLGSFFSNKAKTKELRLFFDAHYFSHRRMFAHDLLFNKISFIDGDPYQSLGHDADVDSLIRRALDCAKTALEDMDFLGTEGKAFFREIFIDYISLALREQIFRYNYLGKIVRDHEINATLCDGPDTPETFYCRHLMDRAGGLSYFLSHGLLGRKDRKLDRGRESIAHHYFYYSENEKDIFADTYGILSERFHPVRFFEKPDAKPKSYSNACDFRVLILLDNFQVSLVSKLNYFKPFNELSDILRNLGITRITVRVHGAFFNYYNNLEITDETRNTFFDSLPTQKISDVPLKDTISEYDIVVGPLTSCILEAMWAKTFFIPFIPDYFPAKTKKEIIDIQWFTKLYPSPCTDAAELRNALQAFIDSPEEEYEKFLTSVKEVGNCERSSSHLWKTIGMAGAHIHLS